MSDDAIHRLKKQLADSQGLQSEQLRLSQLREKLDTEMTALEQEILKSHYKPAEIESKKKLIAACQTKMLEIDHILDELEEWTEEKTVQIKKELIALILERHPEQKHPYADLSSQLYVAQTMDTHLNSLELHLTNIVEAIDVMIEKRVDVKRRSILSYILGPNPNVVIGRCLKAICDSAEACLADEPQMEDLQEELQKIVQHCRARWGFRTIDQVFVPAKERMEAFLIKIHESREILDNEIENLERAKQNWIEEFSQ